MKAKRCSCRFRSLLSAVALVLLVGVTKPVGGQNIEDICYKDYEGEVECISAILSSTDQTEIDTWSETWEDYFGQIDYGTYEEAYLDANNYEIDENWAVDDGSGDSTAYMSDPVVLGDTYLLVTDHYLWDEGSCEDPYYDWDECTILPLTTTGVWVVAGAPYITNIQPSSAQVGSSSVSINVYGDNLIDPFTYDIVPQMTGTGITLNSASGYSSPVTVNYSFALDASTGNQALTLANRFGTSNGVNFNVYDPPPNITGVSPSVWQAGATTPVRRTLTTRVIR